MTNVTVSADNTITYIRIYIICRYFYLIIFSIGIIGNLCNLIIFFRKRLRSNSCSTYFIAYSINNFFSLTIGLFLWSLTLGFYFDIEYKSIIYCKIRRYLTHTTFLFSSCLLTMASINRYARVCQAQLTKNFHRYIKFCQHHTTHIIILSTIIFCLLITIHIPIFFQIDNGECYAQTGVYRIFFDIFFLIFYAIFPPVIMIAINIITVKHIRTIKKLFQPRISRREYQFIILVILHSFSNFIFTLPYTINKFIYYTFRNDIQIEKDQLINSITLLFVFMNPSLSFFLYTLTTKSFRNEFLRACKEVFNKINKIMTKTNELV